MCCYNNSPFHLTKEQIRQKIVIVFMDGLAFLATSLQLISHISIPPLSLPLQ